MWRQCSLSGAKVFDRSQIERAGEQIVGAAAGCRRSQVHFAIEGGRNNFGQTGNQAAPAATKKSFRSAAVAEIGFLAAASEDLIVASTA